MDLNYQLYEKRKWSKIMGYVTPEALQKAREVDAFSYLKTYMPGDRAFEKFVKQVDKLNS